MCGIRCVVSFLESDGSYSGLLFCWRIVLNIFVKFHSQLLRLCKSLPFFF